MPLAADAGSATLPHPAAEPIAGAVHSDFSGAGLDALFAPFRSARGLLLAVSGGPDSVALMLLAAAWASAARIPVQVATVDHRLRPGARAEAEQVARWATACGLPHQVLVWEGPAPRTRVQERAREARYALLMRHARAVGADHLVTAHHADDQAETILFRLVRGSGVAGLSGMAPEVRHGDVALARPLLGLRKVDLVAVCAARGHPFVTDPSNADLAYARTRMRRLAGLLAEEGLDNAALLRLGRRAARADAALAARAAAVGQSVGARDGQDGRRLDAAALAAEPDEIILRVLEREIAGVVGSLRPLRLDRLETIAKALRTAIQEGGSFATTLGGAALRLDRDGRLGIRQAPPRRGGTARRGDERAG